MTWIATERCQPAREISSLAITAVGAVPSRGTAPASSICASNTAQALPDFLQARLAAPGRVKRIVGGEPGLLRVLVDPEQEHPVEQVSQNSSWFRAMPQTNTAAAPPG